MKEYLKLYGELLVNYGVALHPGEYLILEADSENLDVVRAVTETAMKKGAKDVIVFLRDAYVDRSRALYGDLEEIAAVRDWQKESLDYYLARGASSLLLKSPHPELMNAVSTDANNALFQASNDLRNVIRASANSRGSKWCIACAPNRDWAQFLYPDEEPEKAYETLFYTLMDICRVSPGTDPIENWKEFLFSYYTYSSFMNRHKFDRLHVYGTNGTDFVIGFHPQAFWVGGSNRETWSDKSTLGNIPTNEVSTSPDKYRMDGIVYSTKPLIYSGGVIDRFCLTFREGKVVDAKAEVGQELLDKLLNLDEGSRRLGEIAFVECDCPIAKTGKVFYTTLLDENAACHMALGNGFAVCIPEADPSSPESLEQAHLNQSAQHVDFMFGFEGLNADAITADGEAYPIFRNGKFTKEMEQ